jgi:hypothetical protein
MAGSGQTRKSSERAQVFRSTPGNGHSSAQLARRFSARTGREQSQQKLRLFDHLVGEREQPVRNLEAERLGGPEVDDKVKLGRLHHG